MIAVSSSGKSFRALAAYLAAGRTGEERERVAWSAARNLPTNDPELAAKFMRATAAQSNRVEKPVYHVVLSFDPAEVPDRATMERVADRVLARLGLAEHQAIIVAHRDRAHAHVHLLVNRVHPERARAWERWKDQPLIQQVLREEESALGLRRVSSSLTLSVEGLERDRIDNTSPADVLPSRTGHQSSRGSSGRPAPLNEVIAGLEQHEQISSLKQDIRATRSELDAVQARVTRLELAHARARASGEPFDTALTRVYQDPQRARYAFSELARTAGETEAVRALRDHPERFGPLTMTRRRVLGLRVVESDHEARKHSAGAARAGQEAMASEREMWTAAAEARARRLDEAFTDALRRVFRDDKAAAATFVTLAARDGIDAATERLRSAPGELGSLRQARSGEPNVWQASLDQAVKAGVEAIRARTELEKSNGTHLSNPQTRPEQLIAVELQATREHVAGLMTRERSSREQLGSLPRRAELEHRIIQAADRLLPRELRKLKTMVTAPRLALLATIRSTVRDALLARDERSA